MILSPVDEIKQIRHRLGAEVGFDVSRIFADLRERHRTSLSGYVDTFAPLIPLDAEDLAEAGIGEAYNRLLPELRKYVAHPASVEDIVDNDTGRYSVRCRGTDYAIYGPERATAAFFVLVNEQLAGSAYRFYAIRNGKDLGGIFLTPVQAAEAQTAIPNPTDWPYLPTDEPPWYGQRPVPAVVAEERVKTTR